MQKLRAFWIICTLSLLFPGTYIAASLTYKYFGPVQVLNLWLFFLIAFLLIIGLIFYILLTRGKSERDQNTLLMQQVEERTHEINLQKQEIEIQKEDLEKSNVALLVAKESADRANEAKSEFLANISHEIRTPLNAVIGFSEILRSEATNPKQKSYLESIKLAGNTLLTLITDILDLSKLEAGIFDIQPHPVNIRRILDDIRQMFKQKVESKELELLLDIQHDFPEYILIDEIRIRQILVNLIGNAIKFTEVGMIKVAMWAEPAYRLPNEKFTLKLSVADTGIGIPEDEQEIIFESFRQKSGQSTRKYGGTGLGLSITRNLVEKMQGRIFVVSAPDKGSTFFVELYDVTETTLERFSGGETDFDLGRIEFRSSTVLLADEDTSNQQILCEILQKAGLTVLLAESSEEVKSILSVSKPDLIILDPRLSGNSGPSLISTVKSNPQSKKTPIIIISTKTPDSLTNEPSFDGYVSKPISFRKLFREISRFIPNRASEERIKADLAQVVVLKSINPELLAVLKSEVAPLAGKLSKALTITQVEVLVNILLTKGREFGDETILLFAEQLSQSTLRYDFVKIKQLVNDLSNIIKEER
jgi:two-component system sensor histidine kinase/response regulator